MISPELIGLIGIMLLLILLLSGMPIGLGAALIGFFGIWYLAALNTALGAIGLIPYSKAASYEFTVLPLFILMGYLAFNAGLATSAFETGKKCLGHLPAGLAMATITACAAFGACCGMSAASSAIMGRLVIPEMEKLHYKPSLSAGVVAASGTFAALIPPSGIMVVYAIMTEVSVGKMLMAGLFPGLLTAVLYGAMLYTRVKINPSLDGDKLERQSWTVRLRSLPQLWSILVVGVVIIGGIYTGVFTPTEAAGIGALVSLIMLVSQKGIKRWKSFNLALSDTARTTAMIFLIIVGIVIFARFIAMSRLPYSVVGWISALDMNRYVTLTFILIFYVILGMFMEAIGMLLLTIPVALPVIEALGFDPIWFGVLVVKMIEVALVTPPVGLNVYIIKGVASNIRMEDMFRGCFPFVLMDLIVIILLILFPQIVLFLPNTMS
ncbi:MAG: TRAP transporter large permease [Deltaproteobacteria bacterium]|nr:TRAP transporter large permease [Deltaproteobacteria bacterium]